MFLKPFRVKSQSTMKGSDRKKLRADIEHQYPSLSSASIAELLPNKGDMTQVKIESHSDEHFLVYCFQKNPVFFEFFKKLYPSVYTLWKFPDMLPVFTTYPQVFEKLLRGADLMLPGVEVKGQPHPKMFGNLKKGDLCVVRLKGNKAPVLLGETLLSGEDMYMSAMKGKGVRTIHIFHDHLWEMGDKSVPPAIPDDEMSEDSDDEEEGDEQANNTEDSAQDEAGLCKAVEQLDTEGRPPIDAENNDHGDVGGDVGAVDGGDDTDDEDKGAVGGEGFENSSPENMGERLFQCFKWAIKGSVSKNDLPLLTSNLLKIHMQPFCASGEHLDVKKSSYKKFSKFLHQMETEGFIKLKEISKGVDAIVEMDKSHKDLRGLEIPEKIIEQAEDNSDEAKYEPPDIREVLCVTAPVLPLLSLKGFRKGSTLTLTELRQLVTDYVKTENLQDKDNKQQVMLDPILAEIALTRSEGDKSFLTWNTLITRIADKMQPGCLIQFAGKPPVLKKGKMPPISLKMVQRGSKKKVTIMHNLEVYGIDPRQFAQLLQRKVAGSASVVQSEGSSGTQDVQVQGNQVDFIVQQLLGTYQIPRKYVEGMENASKSKRR